MKNKVIILGCAYSNPRGIFCNGRGAVYDSDGYAPTILTMSGGGNKPMIITKTVKQMAKRMNNMEG